MRLVHQRINVSARLLVAAVGISAIALFGNVNPASASGWFKYFDGRTQNTWHSAGFISINSGNTAFNDGCYDGVGCLAKISLVDYNYYDGSCWSSVFDVPADHLAMSFPACNVDTFCKIQPAYTWQNAQCYQSW